MKVLLVVPGGVTVTGDGDVIPVLSGFVEALASHCQVIVVATNAQPMPTCDHGRRFTVMHPGRRRPVVLGEIRDAACAWRLLRKAGFKFDLVHSFWLGRPSMLSWRLSTKRGVPWVASVGGQELRRDRIVSAGLPRQLLAIAQNRLVLSQADLITAGSAKLVNHVAELGRAAHWLPLFPDTGVFKPAERVSHDGRRPFRILTVADHNEAKDPETLLQTIRELRHRGLDVHLDWVGRELQPGSAQALAEELDIAEHVCVRGFIPHTEICQYFHKADLYIQSSRYESQGVSVCEAAACGIPLVGTAVGILPEIAPEGGIAVRPEDPVALADAVESVFVDPERHALLSRGARNWMSRYSLNWTVDAALELYRTLSATPR